MEQTLDLDFLIKETETIGSQIMTLLKQKEVEIKNLVYFNIKDLRYYIDYLDTLIIAITSPLGGKR